MIDSIRNMVAKSDCISFTHTPREANRVAHWIALKAKVAALPLNWKSNIPRGLANLHASDFDHEGIG